MRTEGAVPAPSMTSSARAIPLAIGPKPPQADNLSSRQRATMLEAGREIRECLRVLEKAELNVVGEVLRGQGEFVEFEHYPPNDVYDRQTHSQYYYHAHGDTREEHGHFHVFIRTGELDCLPTPTAPPVEEGSSSEPAVAHLIGISMDDWGYPLGLFATNRWVTGETWYPADTLIRLASGFKIDHAYPSWPTNRWISAMLRLFHPHVRALLEHRDTVLSAWQDAYPNRIALEDRALETTGYLPVSLEDWMHELAANRADRQTPSLP